MMKKLLAFLLCAVMLVSLLPLGAAAFADDGQKQQVPPSSDERKITLSFTLTPETAEVKVFGPDGAEIAPLSALVYELLPGEYSYSVSCKGFVPVENAALTVSAPEDESAEWTQTLAVELETAETEEEQIGGGKRVTLMNAPGSGTRAVDPVAKIGETAYGTLLDAVAAVQPGETIVMQADTTEGAIPYNGGSFTLDMNGKNVTIDGFKITGATDLTLTGGGLLTLSRSGMNTGILTTTDQTINLTVSGANIESNGILVRAANSDSSVKVESGSIHCAGAMDGDKGVGSIRGGGMKSVVISGGQFSVDTGMIVRASEATVEISGGTLSAGLEIVREAKSLSVSGGSLSGNGDISGNSNLASQEIHYSNVASVNLTGGWYAHDQNLNDRETKRIANNKSWLGSGAYVCVPKDGGFIVKPFVDENENGIDDSLDEFKVVYDLDGGSTTSAETSFSGKHIEENTPTIEAPTKDHFVFKGWNTAGGTVKETVEAADAKNSADKLTITYTAVYAPAYAVTVSNDGHGTASASKNEAEAEAEITLTAEPEAGYEFDAWTERSPEDLVISDDNKFSMPASAVSVKASFKLIPYDMNVTADPTTGGTVSATVEGETISKATKGSSVTLTAEPKAGYAFKEWTITGVEGASTSTPSVTFTMGTSAVNAEAKFELIPYKVSVKVQPTEGGSATAKIDGEDVTEAFLGTEVELSASPEDGWHFVEWQFTPDTATLEDAEAEQTTLTVPSADVTVTAVFEQDPPEKLTVSFEANGHGTAPAAQEIEKGKKASKPADPTAEGWTFGGWYREAACETAFDFDAAVEADVTVYAKWTEVTLEPEPEPEEYTVKLDTDGGTEIKDQLVVEGGKLVKPADPTKPGYEFMGWFADKEGKTPFDFDKPVTADTTVYAKWQKIVYTITKGADSTLTEGNAKELTITVEREPNNAACFGHFESLTVGETTLKLDTDYSAKSGSTIITIKADALNKLKVGEHKIVVKFDDGEVSTKLTVNAAKAVAKDYSPKTGEERTMPLWVSLMLLSGFGLGAMIVRDGKRRYMRKH